MYLVLCLLFVFLPLQPFGYTGCFKKSFTTPVVKLVQLVQLDEDDQEGRIHFQQDGKPPHYLGEVREYLNTPRSVDR